MLNVYNENHENYSKISNYVQEYKSHLIGDYHHVLNKHCLYLYIHDEVHQFD